MSVIAVAILARETAAISMLLSYQQRSHNYNIMHTTFFVPSNVNQFATRLNHSTRIPLISLSETNLKKQGMLPLTFINPDDYEKVGEADRVSLVGLSDLAPGKVRN